MYPTQKFMKIGLNSTVYPTAKICNPELVEIGNNVIIDDFVFIYLKKESRLATMYILE